MRESEMIFLEDAKLILQNKYNIIYIGLYGAQNYNLQREGSDYDYKAVVVPSLDDIVYNRKPVSTTEELPFGQVDVKDIRLMVDQWKKGASNFLELLFTKWYWINPDYPLMKNFRRFAENIAHANEPSAARAMLGMIEEKNHALCHPYPVQKEEIEKHGYAAKQLSHTARLFDMLKNYQNMPYKELLNPYDAECEYDYGKQRQRSFEVYKSLKIYHMFNNADEAQKFSLGLVKQAKEFYESHKEEYRMNTALLDLMDTWKGSIIKTALKLELKEEK